MYFTDAASLLDKSLASLPMDRVPSGGRKGSLNRRVCALIHQILNLKVTAHSVSLIQFLTFYNSKNAPDLHL
jgi:hypothetical protein